MEPFLALSAYDIFVYLLVGIATLACFDLVFGTHFIFRQEWGAGATTMVVILGYLIGQIVSWPAEAIFQDFIVGSVVGYPTSRLVPPLVPAPSNDTPICKVARHPPRPDTSEFKQPGCNCLAIWRAVSGHYAEALPWNLQQRIRQKAPLNEKTCEIDYPALYIEASAAAKKNVNSFERAATFSRLAVFCRNMATVALLALIVALYNTLRVAGGYIGRRPIPGIQPWLNEPRLQALLFFLLGLGMLSRFLYFYRLNAWEVLVTYAYLPFPID